MALFGVTYSGCAAYVTYNSWIGTAREESAAFNHELIRRRAAQTATRPKIDAFYQQFLAKD